MSVVKRSELIDALVNRTGLPVAHVRLVLQALSEFRAEEQAVELADLLESVSCDLHACLRSHDVERLESALHWLRVQLSPFPGWSQIQLTGTVLEIPDEAETLDGHHSAQRKSLLDFVRWSPLDSTSWLVFRRLFKKAEQSLDEELLVEFLLRFDAERLDQRMVPSSATLAYFKRRSRRLLRRLAKHSPEVYLRLSRQILSRSATGCESLPEHFWTTWDLVFGRNRYPNQRDASRFRRVIQKRHGRGDYTLLRIRPNLNLFSDRLPESFEGDALFFRSLASDRSRPWQVLEMAMLRLRRLGAEIDPTSEILERYCLSPSPCLLRCATDLLCRQPELLPKVNSLAIARLFYRSSHRRRKMLTEELVRSNVSSAWRRAFASRCCETLGSNLASLHPTASALDSIELLHCWCADVLPRDLILSSAAKLFCRELIELLRIPGLTPAKIGDLRTRLGIQDMADLAAACRSNRVATVPGFDRVLQSSILQAIALLRPAVVDMGQNGSGCSPGTIGGATHDRGELTPKEIHPKRTWAWGFADESGNVVISPRFEEAKCFSEGVAAVIGQKWDWKLQEWLDGWGFVNENGDFVIDPRFDEAESFSEGLAAVRIEQSDDDSQTTSGGWGFIDRKGTLVIDPGFTEVGRFSEGRAAYCQDDRWGFINRAGEPAIQPQFEAVGDFHDGVAQAKCNDRWGFIDTNGEFIIAPQYCVLGEGVWGLSGFSLVMLGDSELMSLPFFAEVLRMPPGVELAFDLLQHSEKRDVSCWLESAALQTSETKKRVVQALQLRAGNWEFTSAEALQVVDGSTRWVQEAGWELIARSKTDSLARGEIWQYLLDHAEDEESCLDHHLSIAVAAAVAVSSPHAREVVARRLAKFPNQTCSLLDSDTESVRLLAAQALSCVPLKRFPAWLRCICQIGDERREAALAALLGRFDRASVDTTVCRALVCSEYEPIRDYGWRFLYEHQPSHTVLQELCAYLGDERPTSRLMKTILASPKAAFLLLRGGYFRAKPNRFKKFLPLLVGAVPGMSSVALVDLIETVPESEWPAVRSSVLGRVRGEAEFRTAFWKTAIDRLASSSVLADRLAKDQEFLESFYEVREPWFLDRDETPVVLWILGWVNQHREALLKEPSETMRLAVNKDPDLRRAGLQMVAMQGLDLSRALRLVESGLPEAVDLGRKYFDGLASDSAACAEAALALCDSPDQVTREYGWSYVQRCGDRLLTPGFVLHLAESPEAWIRARVAEYFLEHPGDPNVVASFDRIVLRTPWEGRAAKRFVQKRLEATLPDDLPTLQALARGPNLEDSEWAIRQLLKATLAGETVPGLTVKQDPIS